MNAPHGASAEDQLLVQFQGKIAEYERAQILERSRRGKRYRARAGEVSVLAGAPYGYRYKRKTDEAPAFYQVIEPEAQVVRRVYEMYTVEGLSIGEITRRLNAQGIPTRKHSARWERSVVWAMLPIRPIGVPPGSARPTSPAASESREHCGGVIRSFPATVSATSVRLRSG